MSICSLDSLVFKKHFLSTGEIKIAVIINYYLVDFRFIFSYFSIIYRINGLL